MPLTSDTDSIPNFATLPKISAGAWYQDDAGKWQQKK